ncbi:hypothetical protein B2J89_13730 [Acidovorax sp. SRB_24]|nr:hypothetical protein [Acidovorax sp. SRB_24]
MRRATARLDRRMPAASLKTYLVAVILLATVPVALLLTYKVASDVRSGRHSAVAMLQQAAAGLAQMAEQDLTASFDALTSLSMAQALQDGDMPAFEKYLRQMPLRRSQWRSVFVTDAMGRMLLDTAAPPHGLLPVHEETRALVFKVLARGRGAVSDLSWHTAEGTQVVVLAVPVYQNGVVQHVLGTRMSAASWLRLLDSAAVPEGGYAALFDTNERAIAIKEAPLAPAPPGPDQATPETPAQLASEAARGFQRRNDSARQTVVLQTDAVLSTWHRVGDTSWSASVGLPAGPIRAAEHSIVLSALTTMGASLLLGVTLALLLAWRLAEPLRRLAAGGLVPPGQHLPVLEIAQLGRSLQRARERDNAAREALQNKAAEFETLFNSSPIGLAFAEDSMGRSILYNPAMKQLLGLDAQRRPGGVQVFYRGRRLEPGEQPLLRACMHAETVGAMEMEMRVEGRSPAFVVASAVPLLDAQGRARGAVSAVMDITELKQVVALWLAADEGQHARQRLIDLAQEAGHVGFFEYSYGSDALVCTPGMRQLLRAPEPAPLAHLQDWLELVDARDRPVLRRVLAEAVAQRAERASLEYRVKAAPGEGIEDAEGTVVRWLSCRVLLRYGPDGQPEHASGTMVDATEQKEAQLRGQRQTEQEQAARRQAEAANRAKDEFLTMLSHELRNPLGAITAALEVLDSGAGGPATAQRALAVVTRQTRHLTHMVGDLLDAGRVATGKVRMVRAPLDLAQVVERVRDALELAGELNAHAWTFSLETVLVCGDSVRLEQVVVNLLTNAMQYSPAGAPIRVEVRPEGGNALLRVSDEGSGIAPALLPQVFELFVQGERPLHRRGGGLGVGLTMVRRLVELHGGTVEVQSVPGEGATFTVRLPTWAAEQPGAALAHSAAPGPPPAVPSAAQRGGLRSRPLAVVLMEDNDDVRQSMQAMLELDGHGVATAADGRTGLAQLLAQRPDAAIVDIGLPGLDGFEVARRARAGGYAGRMVAVTGYGQAHSRRDALKAGFDAYLVKPVDAAQWRAALYSEA